MYTVKWQFENEPCEREYETIAQAEAGVINNGMAYYLYAIYDAEENVVEIIHNGIIFAQKDSELQADNAAMRAALEKYANTDNWSITDDERRDWWMETEHGYAIAAEVLARLGGAK